MFPTSSGGYSFTVALADEEATRRLMVDIVCAIKRAGAYKTGCSRN